MISLRPGSRIEFRATHRARTDPARREAVTPAYAVCLRIVMSNERTMFVCSDQPMRK